MRRYRSFGETIRGKLKGEERKRPFRVKFAGYVNLEFHGATIRSDAGLLMYRELDEVFGLTAGFNTLFEEIRTVKNIQHVLPAWLRQSVHDRIAEYEDTKENIFFSLFYQPVILL